MIGRIASVLLILFLICGVAGAQGSGLEQIVAAHGDAVNSVAVLSGDGRIVASMKSGQGGQLVVVSLLNCAETRRFLYDKEIAGLVASKSDSGAVWGGQGEMLKKWNVLDGKEIMSVSAISGETIKGVYSDNDGEYIAVWSDNKLAVFRLSGDNATPVWTETTSFRISDVIPDPHGGYIYISGFDGSLVKRTMQGTMANSFVLDRPVYAMDIDSPRQTLLLAMGDQLLRLDIHSTIFTRITALPTNDIILSGDGKTLSALGGGVYTAYAYPAMKVTRTQNLKGNKLAVIPNGGAITFTDNTLSFYDQVKQAQAGKVYILDSGTGFVSPDLNYYGNEQFRTAIADGKVSGVPVYVAENRAPDMGKACTALKEMITSVYPPALPSVVKPAVAVPAAPNIPAVPSISASDNTSAPRLAPLVPAPQTAAPSVPSVPVTAGIPSGPQTVTGPTGVQQPQIPQLMPVTVPTLAQGTEIPSWVIRPNSLPVFSAVKSGKDGAQALSEGRKKIRDDVARGVMKNMLEVELVKNIQSDDVKKRFLWQVGARTGQTAGEYVMQKDVWVSREGTYYVLAFIDSKSVDQIYEPVFQEEMKALQTYGDAEYIKNEPIKWE